MANLLWNEYVTIAVEWHLKQLRSSLKKSFLGLQRDSKPWPLCSRCSALPAELWRPIHWRQTNLLSSSTHERNETQNEMMWVCGNTNEMNIWPLQWNHNLSNCEVARKNLLHCIKTPHQRNTVSKFYTSWLYFSGLRGWQRKWSQVKDSRINVNKFCSFLSETSIKRRGVARCACVTLTVVLTSILASFLINKKNRPTAVVFFYNLI